MLAGLVHGRGRRPDHPTCASALTIGRLAARAFWRPACGSAASAPGSPSLSPRATARAPAIARFSIAHHITGSAAWVAALIMMAMADVLTRLVVIYLRGRRLAAGSAATPARIPAGVRA